MGSSFQVWVRKLKKKKSIKILISKFIKWVIKIDIMTFILSMYGKRAGGKQRLKKQYLHKAAQVSIALVKNAGSKKQQQKISSAQNHQICAQGLAFPSLHLILTHTHERSLSCPAMWSLENKLQKGINQRLKMLEQPQKKMTVAVFTHCS